MQFLKILLVMGVIGVVCWIAGLMLDWFFSFRVRFWVYLITAGGSLGGIWAADKLIDAGQTAPAIIIIYTSFCALVLPSVIFHQWMEAEKAEARKKKFEKTYGKKE
jgi:hypothetical protein